MATPLLYAIMSQEPVFFKYFEYCLLTSILAIGHTTFFLKTKASPFSKPFLTSLKSRHGVF